MAAFLRNNLVLIVKGILLLILGGLALKDPTAILRFLSVTTGLLLLIQGIPLICKPAPPVKAAGILLSVTGILALMLPLFAYLVCVVIFGIYEIYSGILLFLEMRKVKCYPVPVVVSSVLTIVLGVILTVSPLTGIMTIGWLIGVLLILSGLSALAGIRLS